jgi:hypothetical protein
MRPIRRGVNKKNRPAEPGGKNFVQGFNYFLRFLSEGLEFGFFRIGLSLAFHGSGLGLSGSGLVLLRWILDGLVLSDLD